MAIQHAIIRSLVTTVPFPGRPGATLTAPKIDEHTPSEWFNWIHDGAIQQYCYVIADSTVWAPDIISDADIEIISPRSADLTALNAWLDTPATGVRIADFEPFLIPIDWTQGSTTWREVFRHVSRTMVNFQRLLGHDRQDVIQACQGDLDLDLSVIEQVDVDNWLSTQGKPARPTAQRRGVLKHLSDNEPIINLGPLTF